MSDQPYKIPKLRFLMAYRITFLILLRYLRIYLLSKILPKAWVKERYAQAHVKTSHQIISSILKLKGLYIKIGQTLSIMTNFLPEKLTSGLETLQDAVPPHPFDEIKERFILDLGKTPEELFKQIDPTPIASASLGQVHKATLRDGSIVAVKLQYPHIDTLVKSDLKTIKRIFGILNAIFPHYGINDIYQECSLMILDELDYQKEGKGLEAIAVNFSDDPTFRFPKVYWEYSSQKIITLEFMHGTKVTHFEKLKSNTLNPHDVAVDLINSFCKQIFIDGVYHADPHPGNIMINPVSAQHKPYEIVMLDFGATSTVSPNMREGMALFVEALMKKDTRQISNAM